MGRRTSVRRGGRGRSGGRSGRGSQVAMPMDGLMSCRSGAVGCALGDGRTRLYGARDPALAGEANPAVHRCPSSRRAPPHDGSIGGCALHLTAGGTLPRTAPDGRSLGLTASPSLSLCGGQWKRPPRRNGAPAWQPVGWVALGGSFDLDGHLGFLICDMGACVKGQ